MIKQTRLKRRLRIRAINKYLAQQIECVILSANVEVAQLVRASVSYALGREFKSRPRHSTKVKHHLDKMVFYYLRDRRDLNPQPLA